MADSVLFNSGNPDWYEYGPGNFLGSGAMTFAAICRPTSGTFDGATHFVAGFNVTAGTNTGFGAEGLAGTPHFFWFDGTNARSFNLDIPAQDEWYLAAVTKASGTVAPRFHQYRYSTAGWNHSDSAGTSPNMAGVASYRIGTLGVEGWTGNILIAGLWDSVLSDGQVESLILQKSQWAGATEAWRMDSATSPSRVAGTGAVGSSDQGILVGEAPAGWVDISAAAQIPTLHHAVAQGAVG